MCSSFAESFTLPEKPTKKINILNKDKQWATALENSKSKPSNEAEKWLIQILSYAQTIFTKSHSYAVEKQKKNMTEQHKSEIRYMHIGGGKMKMKSAHS